MDASLRAIEELAVDYLLQGEPALALAELSAVVDAAPDEGRLWELLGIGHWEIGQVRESIAALETAMTLVPLGPEATLALGLGYEVIQKLPLAKDLFIDLAGRDALPLRVLEPLARGLGRANESGLALAMCERAATSQPDELGPLMGMVFYMGRLGRPAEHLLPVLLRALGLAPEDFTIRMLAARCLHDCGLAEDAAELLRVADYLDSSCPSCLHAMQEIFLAAGDEPAAADVVERLADVARQAGDDQDCC